MFVGKVEAIEKHTDCRDHERWERIWGASPKKIVHCWGLDSNLMTRGLDTILTLSAPTFAVSIVWDLKLPAPKSFHEF